MALTKAKAILESGGYTCVFTDGTNVYASMLRGVKPLVQFVEMALKKLIPSLYSALGIYLPLITTNCAVLGVALNNVSDGYNFIQSVVSGFGTGVGYTIAIVLLAGIREQLEGNDIPAPIKGAPLVLFCATLMGMAFYGFSTLG